MGMEAGYHICGILPLSWEFCLWWIWKLNLKCKGKYFYFIKEVFIIFELISLKLPEGWTVHINEFSEELYDSNTSFESLKENLLLLSNPYKNRIVDVGWYPARQKDGEYCLIIMKMGVNGINTMLYSSDEDVVFTYRIKDINQLVDKINEILKNTP